MNVRLTYFKTSGKFYCHGRLTVKQGMELHEIFLQVLDLRDDNRLPGLAADEANDYIILVEVPRHRNAHPKLILPRGGA